ncbi:MAG: carbohydrate kinase family protein [Trueperaceae bacterium]
MNADRTASGAAGSVRLIVAGNASVDLILGPVEPWPRPGTEVVVDRIAWRVGGALGNTALALAGLGVPATLVWDVGEDAMGGWLQGALADAGDPPRQQPTPTSVTVALTHPDGERTFISHLGHLAASAPDGLAGAIEGAAAGDVLLVGGVFLLPRWRAVLPKHLQRARERGVVTALDTGWPNEGWSEAVRRQVRAWLPHVDLFLPNLEEARGLLDAPDAEPDEAIRGLEAWTSGRIALKLGAAGAAYRDGGRVVTAPAPELEVADTVGAGDTFNAALLVAVADGVAWPEAVALAVDVASRSVAVTPRRYPRWDDLRHERPVGVRTGAPTVTG